MRVSGDQLRGVGSANLSSGKDDTDSIFPWHKRSDHVSNRTFGPVKSGVNGCDPETGGAGVSTEYCSQPALPIVAYSHDTRALVSMALLLSSPISPVPLHQYLPPLS